MTFGTTSVVPVFCFLSPPDFEVEGALVGGFDDGGAEVESDLLPVALVGRRIQCFETEDFNTPQFDDTVRDECVL